MIPTCFSQLIGNERMKSCLKRVLEKKAMGHALLFSGPEGIGKSLFAYVVAAALMSEGGDQHRRKIESGNHPDVHVYRPEGKLGLHSIQALRHMCEEVHLPPYEANCKVFIVHAADRMLSYSANALLKTFEEPPPQTKIILLTHSHATLLPTILSRCTTYFFHPISQILIVDYLKQHYPAEESQLKFWANLAEGSLGNAVQFARQKGDANRSVLLEALSAGKFTSFKDLTHLTQILVNEIDARKKILEEEAKELHRQSLEHLSAVQHHAFEKELEGVAAMGALHETNTLFYAIASWYRDLHLLQIGGDKQYLINQDYAEALEVAVQLGQNLPLEKVQKAIEEARLGLQRSMSLNICLENLFLKLERI